jgi:uncharacterized protein
MPESETAPTQAEAAQQVRNAHIAPLWHTVLIIAVLLLFSLGGSHSQAQSVERHGRLALYISTILYEWALVAFIWLGLRARRTSLREIIGGRWSTPEDALMDVAVAIGYWIVALMVLAALKFALGLATFNHAENVKQVQQIKQTFGFLVPQGTKENIVFILLTLSAGFCEEVIYRGYLQRALAALSGSVAVGMVAQAILFGASHGYQGAKNMTVIAIYGFMFGLLAYWRKSLRPGMMAHFGQDFLSGFLLKLFFKQ